MVDSTEAGDPTSQLPAAETGAEIEEESLDIREGIVAAGQHGDRLDKAVVSRDGFASMAPSPQAHRSVFEPGSIWR
jgi:hypothetical protein